MTESEIRQARIRMLAEQWAEKNRYMSQILKRRRGLVEELKKLDLYLSYWKRIKDEIEDELERLERAEDGPFGLLPERGTHTGRIWIEDPICRLVAGDYDGVMVMGPL